jgi:hypothetical protein
MNKKCAFWGVLVFLAAPLVFGADEPKGITVSGLEDFEGEQVTITALKELIPHAGGSGKVQGGAATVALINPRDRISPWTGSGSLTVWVILGNAGANKSKKDKTQGLAGRVFSSVVFSAPVTAIRWQDGKPLPTFDLVEFVEHY